MRTNVKGNINNKVTMVSSQPLSSGIVQIGAQTHIVSDAFVARIRVKRGAIVGAPIALA